MRPDHVAVYLASEGSIAVANAAAPMGRVIGHVELEDLLSDNAPVLLGLVSDDPAYRDLAAPHIWARITPDALTPDATALRDSHTNMSLSDALAMVSAAAYWALLSAGSLDHVLGQEPIDLTWVNPILLRQTLPHSRVPPRLRDDCFAMPQGVDWVPVDDALSRLEAALHPVTTIEIVPTETATGRVLARDAVAQRSNPPAANAAVDGYGFAASALEGAGPYRLPLVAGRAAAGQPFDTEVPRGAAIRILTGAMLPTGVDTVVLEEDTAIDGAAVVFDGPVRPGANTREAGEDVMSGEVALSTGHRLRAPDIALLCALGVSQIDVFRQLRVGVLSTGDEIVRGPENPIAPHQIWDANGPMLLAMIKAWDHQAVDLGHVRDAPDHIADRLNGASDKVDVILTSGGASAGDEDHVSRLLRDRGHLSSWRIALKPGRPLALALWDGTPVFGLPGNPVAAFVCAVIFARPALSLLAGAGWQKPSGFDVPAAFAKRKKPGRREFLRARLTQEGTAEVFRSEGSGRISGLTWATGLVELPDGAADISPGDPVRFLPYHMFGLA